MCMVLYVAAEAPLRIIPDPPPAPLAVRPIQPDEELVRGHLTLPHVYVVGSHSGCSCGFCYGLMAGDEDGAGRASVGALARYLTAAVAGGHRLELYACWDGDEDKPALTRTEVAPAFFRDDADEFTLPERWHAAVVAAAE